MVDPGGQFSFPMVLIEVITLLATTNINYHQMYIYTFKIVLSLSLSLSLFQDALVPAYPKILGDEKNSFIRGELEMFL